MRYFREKAKKVIMDFIIENLQEIEVNSGLCRYNFRCQYNAVHDAITNNEQRIAMCFYIDTDYPIIHFVNINENGTYTDNTLGAWSKRHKYYLIKYIEKEYFFDVNKIFLNYRCEVKKKIPFIIRILCVCEF